MGGETASREYVIWGEVRLGRRWAGVGVWVQAGAALVYLHLRLQTEFYGASRQGEQMVRSFGDSYRR
jgi:hypothetical protein